MYTLSSTEYSTLDGVNRIDQVPEYIQGLGQTSLALTDHGNCAGHYQFWKACNKAGVKPILGCLLKGQEIITSSGVKLVENISEGDLVLTHKGRFRRVLSTMERPYSGNLYTLELAKTKRTLSLTEEHPVFIYSPKNKFSWKKPNEIDFSKNKTSLAKDRWNSYVCLPAFEGEDKYIYFNHHLPSHLKVINNNIQKVTKLNKYDSLNCWEKLPIAIKLDSDFAYFLGLYSAEGSLDHHSDKRLSGSITFTFNIKENNYTEFVCKFLKERFCIDTKVYKRPEKSIQEVVCCNIPVAYLLDSLCKSGAKNKIIPEIMFTAQKEIRQRYIDGLIDGDGRSDNHSWLRTSSKSLAWGFRTLLASIGIWSAVSIVNNKLNDKVFIHYDVAYTKKSSWRKSLEIDDYLCKPIKNITVKHIETTVYNFEVEEDNSYISDFILHNCEAYYSVLDHSVKEKDDLERNYYHVVLLALDNQGLHNLHSLSSLAYTENMYHKPRISDQILGQYSGGVAATSACLGSRASQLILRGEHLQAEKLLLHHADIFKDRFFVELQAHAGEQQIVNEVLITLANKNNLPLIMTADAHYTHQHDKQFHELTLKMATEGSGDGFSFGDIEVYLGSVNQMQELARKANIPIEALTNTSYVSDMVTNDYFSDRKNRYTEFIGLPEGVTSWQLLEDYSVNGLKQKLGGELTKEYYERLYYELGVIKKLGFSDYFLIVGQYVNKARELEIAVGPGRGSAAGSLVAFALDITRVDPIKYGLLFERMLNPGRAAKPLLLDQATRVIAQKELDNLESRRKPKQSHDHCHQH